MSATGALAGAVRAGIPVDPDAETARDWLRRELADPIYHQRPSLLQRAWEWLLEQLDGMEVALSGMDSRAAALLVVGVVVVGGLIALLVAGPVRRARRGRRESVDAFGDDQRSAVELRAAADAAAAQGRWSEAVLDRFRAVLRSLEDRTVLEPRPGRTAHEGAVAAAHRLPTCGDDLVRASRLFDDVCYGDVAATGEDDAWLRDLDRRVAATRPVTPAEPAPDAMAVPR
ncbi:MULTISPECIES: DUF4129 domain-containing protein [unclassified Actinotalea]|uniref:DUF4129 domain-containing protein n=1 Tax=unclassified Actinotalea TaxID=2638618 RepID=UPI0015F6C98D|nr:MULTISPECIES: DUF4129 domain-containing protein [unclassified Actinotalea]